MIQSPRKILFISIFIFLAMPAAVSAAGISITEIMYDLEGSDSKHEWIEIENTSGEEINLSEWKFFENGSNHGLNLHSGEETIPAGGFAIIADDASTFLSDWPGFSGTVFDSTFSLSNTGETLAIRDSELVDVDTVTYTSEQGGSGDGTSLQKISGNWISSPPTPGAVNESGVTQESVQKENEETGPSSGGGSPKFENDTRQISASAGLDKKVIVGATVQFDAEAFGFNGEIIEAERYVWNFGDGTTADGHSVLHTYFYPGDYAVFLDVISGKYSASDMLKVNAIPSEVYISSVKEGTDGFVELHNKANSDINLSWWRLGVDNKIFYIPTNTFILGNTKVIFSSDVTGLYPYKNSNVSLMYPNGVIANRYGVVPENKVVRVPVIVSNSVPKEKIVEEKEEPIESVVAVANAAGAIPDSVPTNGVTDSTGGILKWLTVLFGVILFSVISVILVRAEGANPVAEGSDQSEIKRIVGSITIIEED